MFATSDIISKPVLNLYSGKIEGNICDLSFNNTFTKIQKIKMFDEDEEEYLIDATKIYSIGKGAIVIKNNTALDLIINDLNSTHNNLINKEVFSTKGENLGYVKEIEFNEKLFVENIICQNNSFKPNQILNVAEKLIVDLDTKKLKMKDIKPKINSSKSHLDKKVYILPRIEQDNNEKTSSESASPYKIDKTFSPQKVVGNTKILIGRKALKTIYGLNNEVIVKKDSIISSKNIEYAKLHSKLNELTLFSKAKA